MNKNFLTKQKLRTTQPHKGEHTAFPTRPSARALTTRTLTRALTTRQTRSFENKSNKSFVNKQLCQQELWPTRQQQELGQPELWTTSMTTTRRRASYSLMSPTLLFSFRFIFMIGIFTSNSFQPSFNLDSFITCWVRELVKHDELKTSFQNELGQDQLRTACWTKKVDRNNELHKHLLQKETMEHLQDDQLQTQEPAAPKEEDSSASAKLLQEQDLEINQKKIACHQQEHSDVQREEVQLQELQLSKPLRSNSKRKSLRRRSSL